MVADIHKYDIDSIAGKNRFLGRDIGKFSSSESALCLIDADSTQGVDYHLPYGSMISTELPSFSFVPNEGFLFNSITPRHRRSDELSKELDDIYVECSSKNWDGYRAKPIIKGLRKIVEKFLNALPSNIPDPEISPDPDGEISLEWCYAKNKMFSISIGRKGQIAYAVLDGARRSSGIEVFEKEMPESIIFQINNFLAE